MSYPKLFARMLNKTGAIQPTHMYNWDSKSFSEEEKSTKIPKSKAGNATPSWISTQPRFQSSYNDADDDDDDDDNGFIYIPPSWGLG